MKKFPSRIYSQEFPKKKKNLWRTLVGNLLLSNLIALAVSLVQLSCGEDVNWKLNFSINNAVGLIVWLFNFFFPWES